MSLTDNQPDYSVAATELPIDLRNLEDALRDKSLAATLKAAQLLQLHAAEVSLWALNNPLHFTQA
jgi:hypothetical protein